MSGEEEEVGDDTSSDYEDEEMEVSIFLKFFLCVHGTLNRDTPDGEFGYPVYSSIRRHIFILQQSDHLG